MNQQRILDEFSRTIDTSFWKLYQEKLLGFRASEAKTLEKIGTDRLAYIQGELAGLDWALNLPDRIVRQIKEELK